MNKRKFSNLLLGLVFFAGLVILMYPSISDYINQFTASHAIAGYVEALSEMPREEYDRILESADEYNKKLGYGDFVDGASEDEEYKSLLNVTGTGMMGYIEIKKLKVNLPIYHGTSENILQHSAGHLEGSSLPVGGEGTHAVITGHRGLPTAKLFTDLDRMEQGDLFTLSIMNETLTYEVDRISIVKPEDVSELAIVPGEDHVTLVTCTPYAVNTHRLLVRGVRTDGPSTLHISADAIQIDPILVAPVVAAPILLVLFIFLIVSTGKPGDREVNGEEEKTKNNEGMKNIEKKSKEKRSNEKRSKEKKSKEKKRTTAQKTPAGQSTSEPVKEQERGQEYDI
ncbi:class C sortase [Clostridium transplantifaecale]|uniref:class C sortase n=1 Tax=Clostridium transplantifaecale TaxID=2479838 RepID=UPI000F63596D|nr:class C sortase [Clostridium transplantifaecale]